MIGNFSLFMKSQKQIMLQNAFLMCLVKKLIILRKISSLSKITHKLTFEAQHFIYKSLFLDSTFCLYINKAYFNANIV